MKIGGINLYKRLLHKLENEDEKLRGNRKMSEGYIAKDRAYKKKERIT